MGGGGGGELCERQPKHITHSSSRPLPPHRAHHAGQPGAAWDASWGAAVALLRSPVLARIPPGPARNRAAALEVPPHHARG